MQIVIDIPKEYYDEILTQGMDGSHLMPLYRALVNGTPLPKGHGRIGDLSKIYVELNEAQIEFTPEYKGLGEAKQIVWNAKTIIEADA